MCLIKMLLPSIDDNIVYILVFSHLMVISDVRNLED